jgi:hypothetical protein
MFTPHLIHAAALEKTDTLARETALNGAIRSAKDSDEGRPRHRSSLFLNLLLRAA